MKKKHLAGSIIILLVFIGVLGLGMGQAKEPTNLRRIVIFSQTVNEPAKDALLKKVGAKDPKDLPIINGKAVILPSTASENALKKEAGILRIDEDVIVNAIAKNSAKPAPVEPDQSMPWGLSRIKADLAWNKSTGSAVKVAVIDTGIEKTHADLQGNLKGGVLIIRSGKYARKSINDWSDDHGHGTHVAGTIGAVNNSIGVVGVAPQAYLYGVKVLDSTGSGYLSDIIGGLQWSIDNKMNVVNMSLGTTSNVQSFNDAVRAANEAGITQVAAAGNSGPYSNSVNYPARYPETIAVAASGIDSDGKDYIADFSSRGSEIDITAPGVSILSTSKGGGYTLLSGTSMAAPHVAGVVALLLQNDMLAPAAVKTRLATTAGNLGFGQTLQGAGMINAQAALQPVEVIIEEPVEEPVLVP